MEAARSAETWGAGHHAAYRKLFNRITGMVAICEDLPEAHNTVTLDPHLKDSDGIPAPKIDYTLSANSRHMLDHAVARGSEALRAAGVNPTCTIQALALYVADNIKQRLANLFD